WGTVSGISTDARKHCCTLGTNFSTNGLDCKTFQPPIVGIEKKDEKVCLQVVDVCCKKRYREQQCDKGTEDAKNGVTCSTEDGERKDCCEACQTGIDIGKAKEPCQDVLGLGPPFDKVFVTCCEEASKPTATLTTTTSTTTAATTKSSTGKPLYPRRDSSFPSAENICDSDVCAQLCEPVGNSYKCDCFKGYILMEDGISCKPQKRSLKKGGRCETHNPCDHDCTDTGTAIKCSCRQGYELAEDNTTCKDIDECVLNLHDCRPAEECINEIGTFACYESSFGEEEEEDFDKKCPTGYKYNFEKLVCDDIDECMFELMCVPPKTCRNTIGSFICEGEDTPQCPPGFHFKAATQTCTGTILNNNHKVCFCSSQQPVRDIDECLTGNNDCNKESQVCVNTKGNYTCVDKASKNLCPPGFKKNTLSQLCEDINECEEDPDLCKEEEQCVNEEGGHTCVPRKSSKSKPTTTTTTTTKRPTTSTTTTTTTTIRPVVCPKGYKFSSNTNTCDDINECAEDSEACASSERCINTIGSFQCICTTGFTKDALTGACVDINECQVGIHNCLAAERCDNTVGSYHCSRIFGCGTGYTLNYANGLCEDDDECILGTHTCNQLGPNFKCRNILGSYRCDAVRPKSRPAVYLPPPVPVPPVPQTTLRSYPPPPSIQTTKPTPPTSIFTTTSTYPTETRTYPTPTNMYVPPHPPAKPFVGSSRTYIIPAYSFPVVRQSTPPPKPVEVYPEPKRYPVYPVIPTQIYPVISGQLKKCLPGYVMNSKGECEDINECENNPCGRHEKCLNFNGRYECASPMQCKIGFELNDAGDQCVDVNECARGTHKCNPTQICKNGKGYYACVCPPGHHLLRSTETCEDMDECKLYRPCDANAECMNTKGSYRCECKDGFRKNNNVCDDIDECKETPGLCEHNCVNMWGSFRCSCNPGFTLNYDNRTCTDVDECERFKDRKLCIGTCKNVPGSYTCECPPGYKLGGDGRVCKDIDECEESRPCSPEDVCLNIRGGYKCYQIKCPKNYVRDVEQKPSHDYRRCKRLQSLCDSRDYQCLLMPKQYTYQYMTLVSNLPLPEGHIQLFNIKGPQLLSARAEFSMKLLDVNAPYGIQKVDDNFFQKINNHFNSMQLYLTKPIQGPQEIKIQIEMRLYQGNTIIGNVVVYIIIVVSEYPF
ncbi:hypothetical protein NQ315_010136, partial [Exocentrus adspersus]